MGRVFLGQRPLLARLSAVALLLVLYASLISSLKHTSPTYDEYEYLSRGYTYLRTGNTDLLLRHPILLDNLAAAPLLLLPQVQLPPDYESLAAGDFHVYSRIFFWEQNGAQADLMIWVARMVPLFLSLLLAILVYCWATAQFGRNAGLFALALTVFDPNLRAHGRLVTPDVGQTAFFFLASFLWWRYLQRPTFGRFLAASAALGLAQTAGFPGLILYPVLAVVTAVTLRDEGWKKAISFTVIRFIPAGIIGLGVIWVVYGLQTGPIIPGGINVPAPYHWRELLDLFTRLDRQDLAYLMGDIYRGGRWEFFIVALFVKTPLPLLILTGWGIFQIFYRRQAITGVALWLFPTIYFLTALMSNLNIGYRHIFPVLPYLWLLAGSAAADLQSVTNMKAVSHWRYRVQFNGIIILLIWMAIGTTLIHPYYLTYFNEIGSRGQGGRYYLVVSDLDWGQDLVGLAEFVQASSMRPLYLSYFGTTPPEYYGLDYRPLPAWPPRELPGQNYYHPIFPLPGMYAISVANLVGARFAQNPDTFAWFVKEQPIASVGGSIDIFIVPRMLDETAPPVDLLLADAELQQLPAGIIENEMRTNDIRPRWVNLEWGMMVPNGLTWLLQGEFAQASGTVNSRFLDDSAPVWEESGFKLYKLDGADLVNDQIARSNGKILAEDGAELALPLGWKTAVSLHSVEWITVDLRPNGAVELLTTWRIDSPTRSPLTTFAHLLDSEGQIVAQFDGVSVLPIYWYEGDFLIQRHRMELPDTFATEEMKVAIGWYQLDTLTRLPLIGDSDRVLLPLP